MTEAERDQGLTVEMKRPTGLPARSLAVKVGTELVELDADIVARLEALTEDVNAGRTAGTALERAIQAGLGKAEEEAPDSGNMTIEREFDEQTRTIDPAERPARPADVALDRIEVIQPEKEAPERKANLYPLFRPTAVDAVPAPLTPREPSKQ